MRPPGAHLTVGFALLLAAPLLIGCAPPAPKICSRVEQVRLEQAQLFADATRKVQGRASLDEAMGPIRSKLPEWQALERSCTAHIAAKGPECREFIGITDVWDANRRVADVERFIAESHRYRDRFSHALLSSLNRKASLPGKDCFE